MKRIMLIFTCALVLNICPQDLASKLTALEQSLKNLSTALTGGTVTPPNIEKPIEKPIVTPKTIQTPAEKDVAPYFNKYGSIELPLEGYFGEVRTADGKTILKGKLYYGVVKDGVDVGRLGVYAPEVIPGTDVKDFFAHGKFMYPTDKKKNDTYNLIILFDPVRDSNYEQNKKSFTKYNADLAKSITTIETNSTQLIDAYATLNQALAKNPADIDPIVNSFVQALTIINASLKKVVEDPSFSLITDTNLSKLTATVQKIAKSLLDTLKSKIAAIEDEVNKTKATTLKKNIGKKLAFFQAMTNLPEMKELITYTNKINGQKAFVVGDPENQNAKKMYEDLVKEEKKSSGEILTTVVDKIMIAGIQKDLELWENNKTKYSTKIQGMIALLRKEFNDKNYTQADATRADIQKEIDIESGDGWE